jgi:NADP-dependent 3-hydroxy acid dehydrogenase YdfG
MNRVVMITGATSGIGEALALEWASRGAKVVAVGRRADRLRALEERLGADRCLGVEADVCVDGSMEKAVEAALAKFARLDVVVANAGMSVSGTIERLAIADFQRQFDTNVYGVIRTVQAVIPALEASRGALAIVGSVMGYVSMPGSGAYAMSKYAVRALTEALYGELAPKGIAVTHIAPGFVESEIRERKNDGTLVPGSDPVPAFLVMKREVAAKQIATAVDARAREYVVTLHGKVAASIARHAPELVHLAFKAGASKLRHRKDA